jgi:dTDP-4-dehydrorhamnose reductase
VRLAREREELRIVADQIGAPTSARTLATTLVRILAKPPRRVDERSRAFLTQQFKAVNGLIHVANAGETSWHGFACAIIEGLKIRGMDMAVRKITPIGTEDFPTKAVRPRNSRLSMERLSSTYGLQTPTWQDALANELDTVTVA